MVRLRRRAPWYPVYTQDIRDREHWSETNDCTVRALTVAGSMRYQDAYAIMELSGRKSNKGANVRQGLQVAKDLGLLDFEDIYLRKGIPTSDCANTPTGLFSDNELRNPDAGKSYWSKRGRWCRVKNFRTITLSLVLKKIPKGRYILATLGHAFAVVNGQVCDSKPLGLTSQIWLCYRIHLGGRDGQSNGTAKTE